MHSVKPRKENQKRLKNVQKFFKHAEAPQLLRRVSLSFQLTGAYLDLNGPSHLSTSLDAVKMISELLSKKPKRPHPKLLLCSLLPIFDTNQASGGVEAMMSEKPAPATGGAKAVPTLVRLCNDEATTLVADRLESILEKLCNDPVIEVEPTVDTLMSVGVDLNVRLAQYKRYPAALCRLSKKWFPRSALRNAHSFLVTSPEDLDVGASLELHALAWKRGSEALALHWLMSDPLQEFFGRLAEIVLANSLDAERRHAEVKQWEGSKLTHIATASRNALTARFLRWRQQQSDLIEAALMQLRRSLRTNVQALAWQQPHSTWRPQGIRWTAETAGRLHALRKDTAATGASAPGSCATGSRTAKATKATATHELTQDRNMKT